MNKPNAKSLTAEEQKAMSIWEEALNTESMRKAAHQAGLSFQQTVFANEG